MRVSILAFDLSHNCLGRTHVLAQILQRNHEVEIIGPKSTGTIWEPLRDRYDYRGVTATPRVHSFPFKTRQLRKHITGDIIYARKPKVQSFGIGLFERLRSQRPLLLDIEDWELGFIYENSSRIVAPIYGIPQLINLNSFYYTYLMEKLTGIADEITVSNNFLENRFGGTVIPHVRDTSQFDPARFDVARSRESLGLPRDDVLVMFSGTPHPHKGVNELVEAISRIDRKDVRLVLVGGEETESVKRYRDLLGDRLIVKGPQPFDDIPEWVSTADIVVIPQRNSEGLQGQIPAKLFDAMAMAKPIVSTDVSDIARIVDDCGIIVPRPSPEILKRKIEQLVDDPERREELGRKARTRCVERYSIEAYTGVMDEILERARS